MCPWDCQLQQHSLPSGLHQQLSVPCQGQACRRSCAGIWLLSSSDKGNGLLGWLAKLRPFKSSADGFSVGLHGLIMPPSVPPPSKCLCTAAEDVLLPCLERSGHAGDSAMPHMCRFYRLGSTSYTAWRSRLMW